MIGLPKDIKVNLEKEVVEQKQLFVLFGPPGSGKNFVGDILAAKYGFLFYDSETIL